jgi:hypothetical protein
MKRFEKARTRITQIPRILFWIGLAAFAAGVTLVVR